MWKAIEGEVVPVIEHWGVFPGTTMDQHMAEEEMKQAIIDMKNDKLMRDAMDVSKRQIFKNKVNMFIRNITMADIMRWWSIVTTKGYWCRLRDAFLGKRSIDTELWAEDYNYYLMSSTKKIIDDSGKDVRLKKVLDVIFTPIELDENNFEDADEKFEEVIKAKNTFFKLLKDLQLELY